MLLDEFKKLHLDVLIRLLDIEMSYTDVVNEIIDKLVFNGLENNHFTKYDPALLIDKSTSMISKGKTYQLAFEFSDINKLYVKLVEKIHINH
jgi:hypothetical protein